MKNIFFIIVILLMIFITLYGIVMSVKTSKYNKNEIIHTISIKQYSSYILIILGIVYILISISDNFVLGIIFWSMLILNIFLNTNTKFDMCKEGLIFKNILNYKLFFISYENINSWQLYTTGKFTGFSKEFIVIKTKKRIFLSKTLKLRLETKDVREINDILSKYCYDKKHV